MTSLKNMKNLFKKYEIKNDTFSFVKFYNMYERSFMDFRSTMFMAVCVTSFSL